MLPVRPGYDMKYFAFNYSTTRSFSSDFVKLFGPPREPDSPFFTEELCRNIQEAGLLDKAQEIIRLAVPRIAAMPSCGCPDALQGAIITAPYAMPPDTKTDLDLIIGKYIS